MRYQTRLFIKLNLLAENYKLLQEICPNNKIIFMIKADAYGHGMVPIVRFAITTLGIKEFGCASLGEALKLRDELPELEFDIYVFSDIQLKLATCSDFYLNRRIMPIISNMVDLEYLLQDRRFKYFPICLKFNTGMNRLGFPYQQLGSVINKLLSAGRKSVYHLFSHFACASSSINSNSMNTGQYQLFLEIKNRFINKGITLERTSIANSGAIEQNLGLEETHIRPGLLLYGPTSLNLDSRKSGRWKGKTISSLETNIISVFKVKKGDHIGYSAIPAPFDGVMTLIALGYGDGFSCRLKGPNLYHQGHTGKILGRVNMDMTQVIFKEDAFDNLNTGDKFIIWGHNQEDLLKFSDQTGTIPYENLCQLTNRVPRIYGLE